MSQNYLLRLEYLDATTSSNLRPVIASLADATAGSRPSTVELRESTLTLRGQNVQQAMNEATDRMAEVLSRLISDFDAVVRFTTAALRLLDNKIEAARVTAATEAATNEEPELAAPGESEAD